MNLRKIEVSGFKSFMSPLELDFTGGITAILGPNGCGKSNVVDSIRWVLGEQRTRLLRNTKMENVLFNGTRLRKPLGMAEVHMTLSNRDHSLNLAYDEVTIGRRLYRSGVSEYLINGQPVRLKEIRNLLVDTGLGNSAYSIIERDMVERVLSDKDQDKRQLIEEAAGVMRYRIQREEAERKIKATEGDLLRLGDILVELDKECRSLKYQMGKARKYSRMKEEADQLETVSIKAALYRHLREEDDLKHEREQHEQIRLADDNEIAIRDNRLAEVRVSAAECEHHLQEINEKRFGIVTTLQQNDEKIAIHNERTTSSRARIVEDETEVSRSQEKLVLLASDLDVNRQEAAAKRETLSVLRVTLSERRAELQQATGRLEEARDVLRRRKQLALDLVKEKEREKGALEHIENSISELADKQDAIESQLDDLSDEEINRVGELSEIEKEVSERQGKVHRQQADLVRLSENLDRIGGEAATCDDEYADVNRMHTKLAEKSEFLQKIKREHTRWSEETLDRYEGLSGVLSDYVRVDKKYRKCFEACLSPILKAVVAGSREQALSCLTELRDGDAGRVQILFSDQFQPVPSPMRDGDIIGPAADLVAFDHSVAPFVRSYLAGVAVVADVEAALRVLASGRAGRVSTLDGVFFDGPGRIIVAGSDDVDMTILEYESKLEELSQSLQEAGQRMQRLAARRSRIGEDREQIQKEIGVIRTALAEEEREFEQLMEKRRSAELHLVRVKEKITNLGEAISETKESIAQFRARLEVTRRNGESRAESEELEGADLSQLEEILLRLEREKEHAGEVVGQLRLDEVSLAGEVEAITIKIRNFEKFKDELEHLIRSREEDAERCREQIKLSEEDTVILREAIGRLHAEKEAVEKDIDDTTTRYEGLKESRDALESELKEMKEKRDSKRENLERVSVAMATVQARITALIEKATENFGQDLRPYLRDRALFDPAEWDNFDHDALDEIKRKLESFGPVNMLAVEEYDEKNERLEFLVKQKADLEEAKDSLSLAIRRINKEARRLLNETFDQVRKNFRETFLTLFDGGEVDLQWADSDDPLEASIKITASPRGKRIKDISNLSSGERALVALSLLFGVYLVKPSPFCVFDEVDAPLDDANIARFVRLLKSFTDHTQFIVITHNKKTMEAAEHLYGVTMEEPGVSKLISVHLDDAERFKHRGTISSGDAGAAEAARA